MTFTDNVKSTVDEKLVPKCIDTVLNSSPLTLRILGNQKVWSGTKMKFPIKYLTNTEGKSFDGLDKFSTTKVETREMMEFSPTGREMPVVLSGMEVDVNATDKQVLDLVQLELASSASDMSNDIAGLFFTAQTGKNFLSVYDASDDGTNTATYGGLTTRATYHIDGEVDTSTGALTAAKMRTLMNEVVHGNDKPTMIVTTKAVKKVLLLLRKIVCNLFYPYAALNSNVL